MIRLLFALAAALLLGGCDLLLPGDCPTDIGWEVRPAERTLRVGESFTAEAFVLSCGARHRRRVAAVWRSSHPAVARVDSLSGRITGVTPGVAQVQASDPSGSVSMWSPVGVTVLP